MQSAETVLDPPALPLFLPVTALIGLVVIVATRGRLGLAARPAPRAEVATAPATA